MSTFPEDDDDNGKQKRTQSVSACDACMGIALIVFLAIAGVVIVSMFFVTQVPAGYVGIVDTFGHVDDKVLGAGLHLLGPFSMVYLMSIKTQMISMVEDVPSKEGLSVHLEAAALYRLDPDFASTMYKHVGRDYEEIVVKPQFRSIIRSITSDHDAKDLYTSASRTTMTSDLKSRMQEEVKTWGLIVESTPLKQIALPPTIQRAIEQKLQSEQASQQMEFVLIKESKEAERKRIEAQGIQDFQNIVREGIDDHLLRWKGIEATEKLAFSSNTKVIVIGSGSADGLPIILNQ